MYEYVSVRLRRGVWGGGRSKGGWVTTGDIGHEKILFSPTPSSSKFLICYIYNFLHPI